MNSKTRQTIIGVVALVLVQAMALHEGYNGRVTMAVVTGIVGMVSGHWWDDLSFKLTKEG